jgi:hypothetical protein
MSRKNAIRTAAVVCVTALCSVPMASASFFSGLGVHTNGLAHTVSNPACVIAFTVPALGNDNQGAWTVNECIKAITTHPNGTQSFSAVVTFIDASGNSLSATISGALIIPTDRGGLFQRASGSITGGTGIYAGKVGPVGKATGSVSFIGVRPPRPLDYLMKVLDPV